MKKILRYTIVINSLGVIYRTYMRLCYLTSKKQWVHPERHTLLSPSSPPLIVAFWHSNLAMMQYFTPYRHHIHMMISKHGDGELIARTIQRYGFQTIRGSSNRTSNNTKGFKDRGGIFALRTSINLLRSGKIIAITPDGPRGPYHEVKMGIIMLAQHTEASILPIGYISSRHRILPTWDKFMLPLPFSTLTFTFGEPIIVDKNSTPTELEIAQQTLKHALNACSTPPEHV